MKKILYTCQYAGVVSVIVCLLFKEISKPSDWHTVFAMSNSTNVTTRRSPTSCVNLLQPRRVNLSFIGYYSRYVKLACALYIVVQLVIRQLQASSWVFIL